MFNPVRTDARRNRDAITGAARELVARDGAGVRVDEVAERARVAVGTIYRHFPTKADLVGTVVDEAVQRVADLAEEALRRTASGASAWDELTGFFTALDDGHSAGRTVRLAAELLGVATDAEPEPLHASGAGRARTAVADLLLQAQQAGDMRADATLGDLFMLMAQAPDRDRPQLRARYVEIVKSGLRPVDPNAALERSEPLVP